jgi:hypothetical protein
MHYPYLLYCRSIRHEPVFPDLTGEPCVIDLSHRNPELDAMDVRDQESFQRKLDERMGPTCSWGFAGYLERRDSLLRDCPQMMEQGRFFHLGLDVIVPRGTPLHAPLSAVVADTGYEEGEGNYGGWVLLRHQEPGCKPFYSLYGHLCRTALPEKGRILAAGEAFAATGDFHENGNWFYHTHIQVITQEGIARGYVSKGYGTAEDLPFMEDLCPSPLPLFKR